MSRDQAIQKALKIARKTGSVRYVVCDPGYMDGAEGDYHVARDEDIGTFWDEDEVVFCSEDSL